MNIIDSIILGIVEGITEFLPISSTGHLILTSHWMGLTGQVVENFEVFIQLGAILAVVFLYHTRFRNLFDFKQHTGFAGKNGWILILATILPIMALGYKFGHTIKAQLFNPITVAWALGIGGLILILIERRPKKEETTASLDELTWKQALYIGLFQCLALCPGVSRAGATIVGGLLNGLNRQTAAEYSFIVAVPVMFIVCIKDLLDVLPQLNTGEIGLFAIGFVVSFIAALFAVKVFIRMLGQTTMSPFGIYRIALALLVFWVMR